MYLILGGTGHIGSATLDALLARGEPVTLITRHAAHAERWERQGARIAVCDVADTESQRRIFRTGRRLFLLNPPARPSTNVDVEERRTVASITAALGGSGLERIVALSTYGARPGTSCGDLTVLHELEQILVRQEIPTTIVRSAYLMSNWDAQLDGVREEGILRSMLPADLDLPMVAPDDVGAAAAMLLVQGSRSPGLHHVEGPQTYTPADVAIAFERALDRPVRLEVTPPEGLIDAFLHVGFSHAAAESFAAMTKVTIKATERAANPLRGPTSLTDYVGELVSRQKIPLAGPV